jgi:hypothetical protein
VAVPTLAGPVQTAPHLDGTHGIPYTASAVDLRTHGYTEQEYFVSGTARAYSPVGALTSDGNWTVTPTSSAPYKTRIIVRRPIDMRRFNGTVVVEWMNATTGRDLDVGWVFGSNELLREGAVYVGVSAQALPITSPTGLQAWDPERYGSLSHPGDQYSYDIFSQVGQALETPRGADPLAGARPRHEIAYGDSQSAFRLVTYLDAIQPHDRVYDGFLVHSRFGNGAALNTGATPPTPTFIRGDTGAKVLTLETETDILRNNGFLASRQPDSDSFRLWEAAGTSHFIAEQEATMRLQAFRESPFANPPLQFNSCPEYMDNAHEDDLLDTAFHDVDDWVSYGRRGAPPEFPLIPVVGSGPTADYAKDSLGLSLGGVRLPQIDVPTGVESGRGNTGTGTCTLGGLYAPFSAAQLQGLYPTHAAYVHRFAAEVASAVRRGVLQPYDAEAELDEAVESAVPATSYVP